MTSHFDTHSASSVPFNAYDLGVVPYSQAEELQVRLRRAVVDGDIPGALLLLEHPPVITIGAHAPASDLLDPAKAADLHVAIARSERGGRSTLHAPGQLVSYPILRIPQRDLRGYVTDLEEVLVGVLATTGLRAERRDGRPGLFVNGMKIASIGLRCEHGVSSHGSSLNVDADLSLFNLITSCGEPSLKQTSILRETGRPLLMDDVKTRYVEAFEEVFGLHVGSLRSKTCDEVSAELL